MGAPLQAASLISDLDQLKVTSPEMVFHVNLEGDFASIGDQLSKLYGAWLVSGPEVPPIPLDFARLFDHLGLTALNSLTMVSEPHPRSGFLNQSLARFSDVPTGLFGLQGSENQPFAVAQYAPADADLALEMSLNASEALLIVRKVMVDLMGPLGQGLLDAQLAQPLVPNGPPLEALVQRLNTRLSVVARLGEPAPSNRSGLDVLPAINLVIRAARIGDLLDTLAPALHSAGFSSAPQQEGIVWEKSLQSDDGVLQLRLSRGSPEDDLILMLGKDTQAWIDQPSDRLAQNTAFLDFTRDLPGEGLAFWYSSEKFAAAQVRGLVLQPESEEAFKPLLQSIGSLLESLSGQQASALFMEANALRVMTFQPTSYPSGMAFAAMALIPTLLASESDSY